MPLGQHYFASAYLFFKITFSTFGQKPLHFFQPIKRQEVTLSIFITLSISFAAYMRDDAVRLPWLPGVVDTISFLPGINAPHLPIRGASRGRAMPR